VGESRDRNAEHAQTAAQIEADVTLQRLGAVYAEGLLDAADEPQQGEQLVVELEALVAEVLDPYPDFEQVLASPWIGADEKAEILDRVFDGRVSPLMMNFLKVAARRGRLDCLRAMAHQARKLLDQRDGRLPVELTTAAELDERTAERLAIQLRDRFGQDLLLRRHVDPELIGGAVLRVGDTMYDGSVFRQLKNLRKQLIDRSVHEIQGGRNRFRDSSGD